jgi:hypothetical protein
VSQHTGELWPRRGGKVFPWAWISGEELEEVQAMPMQGLLLGTVMPMDAACPYVDGDGTANDPVFSGTIPHSLFVVARSRFFPLSWHHTRLLSRFCFIIQFILLLIQSCIPFPIAVFNKSLNRQCLLQRLGNGLILSGKELWAMLQISVGEL